MSRGFSPVTFFCTAVAIQNEKKIILGLWIMFSLFSTSIYKSNLLALLTVPKLKIPFNNVNEFLAQTEIPYAYVPPNSEISEQIKVIIDVCMILLLVNNNNITINIKIT